MGSPASGPLVVVGYDGSDNSRSALRYAAGRAGESGHLVVVNAYAPAPTWFGAPSFQEQGPEVDSMRARGEQLLGTIDPESVSGTSFETRLVAGPPPEAIAQTARELDADEIVVGSRGFYPVRGGLGSVSNGLLQTADRPLVIIPVGWAAREGAEARE